MRARSSSPLSSSWPRSACATDRTSRRRTPRQPPEPLFVRLTVYPTVSLSRYDYNNDIDLYEIRVYVELRRGSQEGPAVADARVTAFSESLEYQEDHFEKRIVLDKDKLPADIDVEIAPPGRPVIKERFPLPAWLVLTGPKPSIVEAGQDLAVSWRFSRFPLPSISAPTISGRERGLPQGSSRRDFGRHPRVRPAGFDDRPDLRHPILALQALPRRQELRAGLGDQRHPLVPGLLPDEGTRARDDAMTGLAARIALFTVAGWSLLAPPGAAAQNGGSQVVPQDELRSVAPNVYLDCERRTCDFEYIKTEITFVNYVLDRQSADVQIIITRQQTGSGGNEYTLAFLGLRRHEGKDATLKYYSKPTDTEDQFRRGLVNVLKQGLIPYVYDTPLAEFISISYAQKKDFRPTPASDPWHYWVFGLGVRGNGEFEDQAERFSYQVNVSANRTTEAIKFRLYGGINTNHRRYEIPDEEPIVSDSKRKNLSNSVFKSIDGHWSWGRRLEPLLLDLRQRPALRLGRAERRVQYLSLFRRDCGAELRRPAPGGLHPAGLRRRSTGFGQGQAGACSARALQAFVLGAHRALGLHRRPRSRASTFVPEVEVQQPAGRRLAVYIDLLLGPVVQRRRPVSAASATLAFASFPGRDYTPEEILLELKRLATGYYLRFEIGLNFRFGSIYSNVVNPRFGNV